MKQNLPHTPNQQLILCSAVTLKFELTKLPLITPDIKDHITKEFDWPMEADLKLCSNEKDIRIHKIEVSMWSKSSYVTRLHSLRIELTNGFKSPLFQSLGNCSDASVIELATDPRKVKIRCKDRCNHLAGLMFEDQEQKPIGN